MTILNDHCIVVNPSANLLLHSLSPDYIPFKDTALSSDFDFMDSTDDEEYKYDDDDEVGEGTKSVADGGTLVE